MSATDQLHRVGPRFRSVAITIATFAVLALTGPFATADDGDDPAPLRIGIIGAGAMGGPLGRLWAEAGHRVIYASRSPETLMKLVHDAAPRASAAYPNAAADFGDVVVLAVPSAAVPDLGESIGELLRGKIVIDLTNPSEARDGAIAAEWLAAGSGVAMAGYLPGARLVKAFNAMSWPMLDQAHRAGERLGVPVAGDDEDAVAVVTRLVRDAGFEPVEVGPLESAREFDRGTPVWVTGMTAREIREALDLPAR
jgi:8-hydroxy-5-deazaflavin:NADPH oxidoreductase